jgi:hypothetical protein
VSAPEKTIDVESCAACGEDHPALPFWRNLDSASVPSHPEWIGMCPEEGEPLAVLEDLEGKEKVVAVDSPGGARKGLSG